MPRLHKYRERNACYVLTAIRGGVITYQLTPDGERKLTAAGIAPGQPFQRALLLDLYRTSDAFTHGSGVDEPFPALMRAAYAEDSPPLDGRIPALSNEVPGRHQWN